MFLYFLHLNAVLSLLLLVDGAVMPSWFDIHQLPVRAESYASLFLSFCLNGKLLAYTVGLDS